MDTLRRESSLLTSQASFHFVDFTLHRAVDISLSCGWVSSWYIIYGIAITTHLVYDLCTSYVVKCYTPFGAVTPKLFLSTNGVVDQVYCTILISSSISDWFLDPYVKIKLLDSKGKRIGKKKKTTVKNANLNPYYNESFVFMVEQSELRQQEITWIMCYLLKFLLY